MDAPKVLKLIHLKKDFDVRRNVSINTIEMWLFTSKMWLFRIYINTSALLEAPSELEKWNRVEFMSFYEEQFGITSAGVNRNLPTLNIIHCCIN